MSVVAMGVPSCDAILRIASYAFQHMKSSFHARREVARNDGFLYSSYFHSTCCDPSDRIT
jgi:hypothetical protein